jgi:stearoyl-CoA desaturase (delta-9 desaturase)
MSDPIVMFVQRTTVAWFGLGLLLPGLVDGWRGFLWGGLVRMALQNHATFAVNSICHSFGSRPYATPDESRNNWAVALWSLGEGWHNNHHAFPSSALHGFGWREPDLSGLVIVGLGRLGLARNVRTVPVAARARRQARRSSTRSSTGMRSARESSPANGPSVRSKR